MINFTLDGFSTYKANEEIKPDEWEVECIVLEPGSVLLLIQSDSFMGPNCLHHVITEQANVAYGNYFFASIAIQQTVVGWQEEDQWDLPHIPQIDTRDGFLGIVALGNLLIFMQSFKSESERVFIELKQPAIRYVYKVVLQNDLDTVGTDQPDEIDLLWAPQSSVKVWSELPFGSHVYAGKTTGKRTYNRTSAVRTQLGLGSMPRDE
ncbi:hypothetical protein EV421DRAFT_1743082 [Armillaria borealis]|uniref:Uncharacterized protein n=1 Tax=Armillaria borealis TaxID=47425 RepID=A0AA39IVY4_9AGAR|nr:hypothetical protein EV421DRAFT_1743082 [Armillaria borealis]